MPRKQTTIVTCSYSGCRDIAEVTEANEAPEGWVAVMLSTAHPRKPGQHEYTRESLFEFSSLRCVEKWSEDRRRYLKETEHEREIARLNGRPLHEEEEHSVAAIHYQSKPLTGTHIDPEELQEAMQLLSEDGPWTTTQLAELMGRPKGTIKHRLATAVENGAVRMVGELPGRGTPAKLYQV